MKLSSEILEKSLTLSIGAISHGINLGKLPFITVIHLSCQSAEVFNRLLQREGGPSGNVARARSAGLKNFGRQASAGTFLVLLVNVFPESIGIFSLTLFYPLVFLFSELAPSFFGFSHSPFVFLEFLVEEGAVKGWTSVANDKNGVSLHLKGGR